MIDSCESSAVAQCEPFLGVNVIRLDVILRDFRNRVATLDASKKWSSVHKKPRSGARIQPTAQAVGKKWTASEPRRGERSVVTQKGSGVQRRSRRASSESGPRKMLRKLSMTPFLER